MQFKSIVKGAVKKPLYIGIVLLLAVANLAFLPKVFAGSLTNTQVLEMGGAANVNPMIAGDSQQLAIDFTTDNATTASGNTNYQITLAFPSSWTGGSAGSVNTSQTIANNSCDTLFGGSATVLPGTTLAASGSGETITITSTTTGGGNTLSAGTNYCTELTSTTAVTNPTTTGDYTVVVTTENGSGSTVDSYNAAIDVLSSGANQYSVSATVAPTFTMTLGGSSDALGTLSSSTITKTTGITDTINTNAPNGWFVWAEDANGGLKSTSASYTIDSVTTGDGNYNFSTNTGSEAYGLGVSADAAGNYNYTCSADFCGAALSSSTFYEIATSSTTAINVTFTTHELADISATTPPGSDYTDTITEIGAGSF